MSQIVTFAFVLAVLTAIFFVIERLFRANSEQPMLLKRSDAGTDLLYWFTAPLLNRAVAALGIGLTLMLIYQKDAAGIRAMLAERNTWLAQLTAWIQIPAILIIGDFISYWLHRAFHRGWLWKVHAVHHSSINLDWLSSVRVHPLNGWLPRWVQATTLVVMGFSPAVIAVYVPFLTFYALLLHANVSWDFGPLRRVIASPYFHRWHHSAEDAGLDRNFAGLFPVWDHLFGTLYLPEGQLPQHFGLRGEVMPRSWLKQIMHPFQTRSKKYCELKNG